MHKISGTCLNLPAHRVTRGLRFKINLKITKGGKFSSPSTLTRNITVYYLLHWDISTNQNFGDNSPPNMSKFGKKIIFLKFAPFFIWWHRLSGIYVQCWQMALLTKPAKKLKIATVQNITDPLKATHPQAEMAFLEILPPATLKIWTPTNLRSDT